MSEENKVVVEVVAEIVTEAPKKKVKKEKQSNVTVRWKGRGRGLSEAAIETLMKCYAQNLQKNNTAKDYIDKVDKLTNEYDTLRFNNVPERPMYSFDRELAIVKKYCKVHLADK